MCDMEHLQAFIVICTLTVFTGLQTSESCPKGWDAYGGSCFFGSSYKLNWMSARQACKALDPKADLASFHSADEHEYFARSMRLHSWIGLNSLTQEGQWEWVDGSEVDFTKWRQGEPNKQHTEKCATLFLEFLEEGNIEVTMFSTECIWHLHYVCQLQSVTCPSRWEMFHGTCYFISNEIETWKDARKNCQDLNARADLASIHNNEELNFFLKRMYFRQWIGLNRINDPFQWEWSDGSPLDYNKLVSVTEHSKRCTELWSDQLAAMDWKDADCTERRHFLCKYKPLPDFYPERQEGEAVTKPKQPSGDIMSPIGSNLSTYKPPLPQPPLKKCPQIHEKPGVTVICSDADGKVISCNEALYSGSIATYQCSQYYEPTNQSPFLNSTCSDAGEWVPNKEFSCVPICGIKNNVRTLFLVSGGRPAERGEWPWHVGIYRKSLGRWDYFCGGTLVSERLVVTAAHCVAVPNKRRELRDTKSLSLGFGKLYKTYDEEDVYVQYREPESIIISPFYNWESLDPDIAIIILKEAVTITAHVRPACCPGALGNMNKDFTTTPRAKGTVLGWGLTENNTLADVLQMVEIPVVDQATCIASFHGSTGVFYVRATIFCAGSHSDKSVCAGDSGGGMVFRVTINRKSRFVLQGIVSSGVSRKCEPNNYAFFTRVRLFEDMIRDNIL